MLRQRWRWWTGFCLAAPAVCGGLVAAGEPTPYTDEWWALRAQDPPGTRQVLKDGKLWPPFPRPQGPRQHWVHQYHHAHYWPHPYDCDDRAYVRNILQQQSAGGWVSATTLHDYHFDQGANTLNSAGRDHLQWIIAFTPPQYRTVYVAQGGSVAAGQVRSANVEQAIREFQPDRAVPVIVRHDRFLGRPGTEIDKLRELELENTPTPRLFTIGGNSSSGGGSSAGGTSGQSASQSGGSSIGR